MSGAAHSMLYWLDQCVPTLPQQRQAWVWIPFVLGMGDCSYFPWTGNSQEVQVISLPWLSPCPLYTPAKKDAPFNKTQHSFMYLLSKVKAWQIKLWYRATIMLHLNLSGCDPASLMLGLEYTTENCIFHHSHQTAVLFWHIEERHWTIRTHVTVSWFPNEASLHSPLQSKSLLFIACIPLQRKLRHAHTPICMLVYLLSIEMMVLLKHTSWGKRNTLVFINYKGLALKKEITLDWEANGRKAW